MSGSWDAMLRWEAEQAARISSQAGLAALRAGARRAGLEYGQSGVQTCPACGARPDRPEDNLHCVADGAAHAWHACGDIKSDMPGSGCPSGTEQ